jgi:glycosyltransferase involved in cell wall biosynthesis
MNILFISQFRIDANKGGVQRVTEALATEFVQRGISVIYLALASGAEEQINGIRQYYIPDAKNIMSAANISFVKDLLSKNDINGVVNQAGIYARPFRFIEKVLNANIFLISVHHNCIGCLLDNYPNIVSQKYGKHFWFKLINHPVGWGLMRFYNQMKYGYLFKYAIKNSDKFVLLSDRFTNELKRYTTNFDASKVIGIPNPAPFDVVINSERNKKNKLLYVGRINSGQKRTELVLKIWKKIYFNFPDWSLDIVGDGPELPALRRIAEREHLPRIHFHGFKDPRPFLDEAKILCMTSAFEGYGMVLVEAQSYGVVPFAFNTFTSLKDIIADGLNGMIVSPFDLDDYCAKLATLMSNEEKRKQFASLAKENVSRYQASKIAKTWQNLFSQLV